MTGITTNQQKEARAVAGKLKNHIAAAAIKGRKITAAQASQELAADPTAKLGADIETLQREDQAARSALQEAQKMHTAARRTPDEAQTREALQVAENQAKAVGDRYRQALARLTLTRAAVSRKAKAEADLHNLIQS